MTDSSSPRPPSVDEPWTRAGWVALGTLIAVVVPKLARMRQGLKAYVDSHPTSPRFFRGRR